MRRVRTWEDRVSLGSTSMVFVSACPHQRRPQTQPVFARRSDGAAAADVLSQCHSVGATLPDAL